MKLVSLFITFFIALQSPAFASQPEVGLRASVAAGNHLYIDTMKRGDARGFAALFDAAAIQMSPGERLVRGRPAIAAAYRRFFAHYRLSTGSIQTWNLERSGNMAYELGSYRFRFTGASTLTLAGHYCTIWKRQPEGRWKIAVDVSQPDPPPGK